MILPKKRDPRFITIRRGGSLTDSDHQLLALWAAVCAEHVLHLFEAVRPGDLRPRHDIDQARASVRGSVSTCRRRYASSCYMTSVCATTSTGRSSTAEWLSSRPHCPTRKKW